MEQLTQSLAMQLIRTLTPIIGSMLVILTAFLVLLWRVRNKAIRELGGIAAALVWFGWMANYYKVI